MHSALRLALVALGGVLLAELVGYYYYRPASLLARLLPPRFPEDDIPELLALMTKHQAADGIQSHGCLSLVATLFRAPDEVFVPTTDVVSTALKLHGTKSPTVAGLCCAAVVEIIGRIHAKKASTSHLVESTLAPVLAILEAHLDDAKVAAECLRIVWLLAVPKEDKDAVAALSVDTVIKVLGAVGEEDERVAEYGAGALWTFGLHNVETRHRILTRGAVPVVQAVMNKHVEDPVVVRQAAGALWTMAAQVSRKRRVFAPNSPTDALARR